MLGFAQVLDAGDSVTSLGVVTSLPIGVPQGTFQLALYTNTGTISAVAPGSLVATTGDIQPMGGDNVCTNNRAVTGDVNYTVTASAYFWITLLVKGADDVVIVGKNAAQLEPTWCSSPIAPPTWPDPAPTSDMATLANCAPSGRGSSNLGAIPYLFAVVSPSG